MHIEIHGGEPAHSVLESQAFVAAWTTLVHGCPWSTVFQSPEFCRIWYRIYRDPYRPVLVTGWDSDRLVGLMLLAQSAATGELVAAGAYLAEYQTWIALPQHSDAFLGQSLAALFAHYRGRRIRFQFVPPGVPLASTRAPGIAQRYAVLRSVRRPLMSADPERAQKSLKKSGNKSKLNRLREEGRLEFRRLRQADELAAVFDEAYALELLRHRAVHDHQGEADPLKKGFYVALLEAGLAHATVLTINGNLVSCHIGNINRAEVTLGLFAFSPLYARHSPGKIHMLLLAEQLSKEGIRDLDLTPEGAYKDRFATHFDEVWTLEFFPGRSAYARQLIARQARIAGKILLDKCGVDSAAVAARLSRLRAGWRPARLWRAGPAVPRLLRRRLWQVRELRVYAFDLSRAAGLPGSSPLNRNRIADFLAPRPGGGQADDFLRGALQRFEDRCYSYTHVDNGLLIHCSWLIPEQPAAPAGAETLAAIGIPAGSCVLETSPSDSAIGGSGLQRAALCQMLRDAAQLGRHEFALIGVMSDDLALRQVVEELGFSYRYSCFDSRRLLRTRRWRSQPAEPAPATA